MIRINGMSENKSSNTENILAANNAAATRLIVGESDGAEKTNNPRMVDSIDYSHTRFSYGASPNLFFEKDDSKLEIVEDPGQEIDAGAILNIERGEQP